MMFKQLCWLQRYTFLHEPSSYYVHLKTNYVTKYTTGDFFGVSSSADFTFSDAEFMDSGTGKNF